ncbi:peptide/nickel transport system permease protein [Sporobacter termitidis DSM 10068]|uniref:Nickel import system permease protein NikB n=1 Tax=Sporobacter termitidis DSM 10068 TaxID=1123282 RepID=A0A1M5XDF4_9FIRM|nr:nickel ABC transporter permease [Sporobacter termitidis]SHH97682.1 peptide/nickel transport system permease protein [Sporobacter termitidis DSM 10068]
MRSQIIRRVLHLIPVMLGVSLITFFLSYLSPSDPAQILLNEMGVAPTQEVLEHAREEMGLNEPVPAQYIHWLERVLHGDFGTSYKYREPVLNVIAIKLPATLKLTGAAMLLMVLIAFPLGILSAVYKNKAADYVIRLFSMLSISMPTFWLALLLIYFFTIRLKLFPLLSGGAFPGIVMPAVTLAFSMVGKYARQLRAAILDEMHKDYVQGALARGVGRGKTLIFHILPNASIPIITMLGLSVGGLLGGTAIVESIFVWPGVGDMALDAITNRDYPLIQGYVIWMALIYVAVNLIVDIIYTVFSHDIELQ